MGLLRADQKRCRINAVMDSSNRRKFVRDTATVAAGAAALGAPAFAASPKSPNDRVRAAIVGLRGRV